MQPLDALLVRLSRRHQWQHVIYMVAPRLIVSALLAAVVIATIRFALPGLAWLVPAVMVAGILAPLPWVPSAWKRCIPRSLIAGELDGLAQAEGLVMAFTEQRDAAWRARCDTALQRVRLPALIIAPLVPSMLAVLMMLGAMSLTQTVPPSATTGAADALVKPLRDQIAELTDRGVLTKEQRSDLEQHLAELVARSQGGALDQATWEGIDRLQTQVTSQAAAAGEKLAAALAAAQAAADPSVAANNAGQPADAANAMAVQLAVDLAKLAEQAPGLVPLDLADPNQRAALAAALEKAQRQGLLTPAQVAALQRAGLTLGKAAHQPGGPTPAQSRALARQLADELGKRKQGLGGAARSAAELFLARLAAGSQSGSGSQPGNGSQPGSGAPSRGPGQAPLDQLKRERTAGGEQAALIPGVTLNPDGSVTVAAQARDAELDDHARAELQRSAARDFDPTAADSRRATVAPRHRAAVEAYFSEPKK